MLLPKNKVHMKVQHHYLTCVYNHPTEMKYNNQSVNG